MLQNFRVLRVKKRTDNGAVLIELSLAIIVVLILVTFIINAAVFFSNYAITMHSVRYVVRSDALNVKNALSADELEEIVIQDGKDYIRNVFGLDPDNYTFNSEVKRDEATGKCLLRMSAERNFDGFISMFFKFTSFVNTESESLIKDQCFQGLC